MVNIISAQDFISFALQCRYIVESSAYWRQVQLGAQFVISVKHKLNNTDPKIDPCGTPNFEYKRNSVNLFVQNGFCLK